MENSDATKKLKWLRTYLLIMSPILMILGATVILRSFVERRSFSGLFLGAAFIIYGFLRWRQRNALVKR